MNPLMVSIGGLWVICIVVAGYGGWLHGARESRRRGLFVGSAALCGWIAGTVFLFTTPACNGSLRHTAVTVDASLYEAMNDAHSLEQQALCGQPSCANVVARVTPDWTDAKSQSFNRALVPAVDGGKQFNVLLAAWKPGTPMPKAIHDLITGMASALTQVAKDFPVGTTQTAILKDIAIAQSAALTALDLYLTVKGGA